MIGRSHGICLVKNNSKIINWLTSVVDPGIRKGFRQIPSYYNLFFFHEHNQLFFFKY